MVSMLAGTPDLLEGTALEEEDEEARARNAAAHNDSLSEDRTGFLIDRAEHLYVTQNARADDSSLELFFSGVSIIEAVVAAWYSSQKQAAASLQEPGGGGVRTYSSSVRRFTLTVRLAFLLGD